MPKGKPTKLTGSNTLYNNVEETWVFKTKDVDIKGDDNFHVVSEYCNIYSVNARNNPIEPLEDEKPKKSNKRKGRGNMMR